MTEFIKKRLSLLLAVLLVFNGVPLNVAAEEAEESTETGTEISTEAPVEMSSEAPEESAEVENSAEVEESPEVKESAEAAGGVAAESTEEENGESVTEESGKETAGETSESEEVSKETAEETSKETSKDAAAEETKTTVEEQEVKEPVLDVNEDGTDSEYPESPHPYENNMDETYTYTKPGAAGLAVTFYEATYTEDGCDFIYLYDKDDTELGKYTGNELSGNTIDVLGDTIKIRLVTDSSVTDYGFSIDNIAAIPDGKVNSIRIITPPECVEYGVESELDLTGMEVTAEFESGESCVIPNNLLTVGEYEFSEPGEKIITVGYKGCTADFTVTVFEATSIEITALPYQVEYYINGKLDLAGMVVTVEFENGANSIISNERLTIDSYDFSSLGEKTITVRYRNCAAEFTVTVIDEISGTCGENLTWMLASDGTLIISGSGPMYNWGEELSQYYCPWNSYKKYFRKVIIENGVTSVASDSFEGCVNLESIELPSGIVSIGYGVFQDCSNLKKIQLPEGITCIKNFTFSGCTSLKNINIPLGVTEIGEYAFSNCSNLESVSMPEGITSIGYAAFENCSNLQNMELFSGIVSVGSCAFSGCSNLQKIELPDGITELGNEVFVGCKNLQNIVLPEGITGIGDYLFAGCSSLETINLPDGLKEIGGSAFENCSSLETINLPNGLKEIGWSAFEKCSSLQNIELPSGINVIDDYVFLGCGNLESINFPEGITNIGDHAFEECNSLQSVEIISEDITIGEYAFSDCDGLQSVTISSKDVETGFRAFFYCTGLKSAEIISQFATLDSDMFCGCRSLETVSLSGKIDSIKFDMFSGCNNLTTVQLPDTITTIGSDAFYGCSSLKNIELPSELTTIGRSAFSNCDALETIELPNKVIDIGTEAFGSCNALRTIYIPASVTHFGANVFDWCQDISSIIMSGNAPTIDIQEGENVPSLGAYLPERLKIYCQEDAVGYDVVPWNEYKVLFMDANGNEKCGKDLSWEFTDGVLTISGTGDMYDYDYWSEDCPWYGIREEIHEVIVGENVTAIGSAAFAGCANMTAVTLPEGLTEIRNYAFKDCDSLKTIELPSGITSIGSYAFSYCTNLIDIDLPTDITGLSSALFEGCSSLVSVELPSGVTSIGNSAFEWCSSLSSIKLPSGVTSIGNWAFGFCSSLSSIELPSSVISIDSCAFSYCESLRSVELPSKITEISLALFQGCSSLVHVELPENLVIIDRLAFSNCENLENLLLPIGLTEINDCAFFGCSSWTSVEIPSGVEKIGDTVFAYCENLENITVDQNNPVYCSLNGVLYSKEQTKLICYPSKKSGAVHVPDTVTEIAYAAFVGCGKLTSVTIPETVNSLEGYVFADCVSLSEVKLSSNIERIPNAAFMNCSSLTEFMIPEKVSEIGYSAFGSCISLNSIIFTGNVPRLNARAFNRVVSNVYYPAGNETWTDDMFQNYGGTLTWIPDSEAISISVTALPNCLEYCAGEELDITGLKVEAVFKNGKSGAVPISEVSIDPYDFSTSGEKTVTVRYGECTTDFKVTVLNTELINIPAADYPESDHPYENEIDKTYTYTYSGAIKLLVKFSENTLTEAWCDRIYLYDKDDNELGVYTGSELAGTKIKVPGDTIKIRLVTDSSVTEYGFSIDSIAAYVEASAAELQITSQPSDYTGKAGDTASFTVEASGKNLTYQWQYQNVGSSAWKTSGQSGNKTKTLKVPITEARDGQKYRCVITDGSGKQVISSAAALHVEKQAEELQITSQPVDYTGEVGETAVFRVTAVGNNLSYQWQYQNAGSSIWKASGQNGNKTNTLSVPITAARDGQKYRCVITDGAGNQVTSNAAALHVGSTSGSEAVTITSQPVDYTGEVGDTAMFRVAAAGSNLSYQWQYQNVGSSVWKASGQSGNKTNTLSVPITAARDGQKYRCVITDGAGNQAASNAAALHVGSTSGSEAVTITTQPADYTGEVGETAVFRVTAAGENLSYQWEYQNVGSSVWKASGQSGNKTNTLSVPITAARDGQKYRCVITDGAGNQAASGVAALHVGSTSGSEEITITSQPADYTGKVGETAVFRVTAAGESLSYQWEYQNAGSSVWKASGQSGNKTNALSVPITAARNGQKYRCVVTDGKGNQAISDAAALHVTN